MSGRPAISMSGFGVVSPPRLQALPESGGDDAGDHARSASRSRSEARRQTPAGSAGVVTSGRASHALRMPIACAGTTSRSHESPTWRIARRRQRQARRPRARRARDRVWRSPPTRNRESPRRARARLRRGAPACCRRSSTRRPDGSVGRGAAGGADCDPRLRACRRRTRRPSDPRARDPRARGSGAGARRGSAPCAPVRDAGCRRSAASAASAV